MAKLVFGGVVPGMWIQIPTLAETQSFQRQIVIKISALPMAHIGGIMTDGIAKCPDMRHR